MSDSKPLPHDSAAERAVIGALMVGGDLGDVSLTPSDFFGPREAAIFRAITALVADGAAVDPVSVASRMGSELETIGGRAILLDYADSAPISTNGSTYAAIVRERSLLRSAIRASVAAQTALQEAERPAEELIAEAAASLLALADTGKRPRMSLGDAVEQRLEEYGQPTETALIPGTSMPLHFGDVATIGGRPGAGKTALALQAADDWRKRWPVLFLSYEMSVPELVDRLVTRATGMPSTVAQSGLSESERALYRQKCETAGLIGDRNLELVAAAGMTEAQIAASIRSFAARGGRAVVLDYAQIAAESRGGNANADLERFMRTAQQTAKQTGVLLLLLSQYSRTKNTDGEPDLSTLRGSGALEQESATVGLMWSPAEKDTMGRKRELADQGWLLDVHDPRPLIRLHWAKARHSATATEYLLLDGSTMRLEPVDRMPR